MKVSMICLEKEVSSGDLHVPMGLIELLIPFIDELVCFDIDRPFLLLHLHLDHLGMGDIGRAEDGEDQTETQNEPAISQDLSLGRK
jgi:hypothetical protein